MSNFWFGEPSHATTATGIRFWRKSPAVGSTDRHRSPPLARRLTPSRALVAVGSGVWASAASSGFSTPPARETGTGSVGFSAGIPEGGAVTAGASASSEGAASVGVAVGADGVSLTGWSAGGCASDPLPEPLSPKVKVCSAAPSRQLSMLTKSPSTNRQKPSPLEGERVRGPAEPLKGKSWESVTSPPPGESQLPSQSNDRSHLPSARPPQLKVMIYWN